MVSDKRKDILNRYNEKAKSSFKVRFDLLLFHRIADGKNTDITTEDLEEFEIADNKQVLDEYVQIYWQQEIENCIRGKKINDIYIEMKEWKEKNNSKIDDLQQHYITNLYERVFSKNDFMKMIEEGKECHYCHTTEDQIGNLIEKGKIFKKHITRGWSLEIDRKEPNLEYTKDNCVMCCYWCNNAKTDEFSHEEFVEIGKAIEKVWHERLKSR